MIRHTTLAGVLAWLPVSRALRVLCHGMVFALLAAAGQGLAQENGTAVPVILAVGESTTAGFGVRADESYPAQLQALLDAGGHRYRVVNHGLSGITSAMALRRLGDGMALQPRIVLLALGGNDRGARFDRATTRENLRRMVSLYKRAGAVVFLADRGPATDGGTADESSLFSELAAEEGVHLMPSLRQGLAGNPDLLLADMSHPNADGYAIVAARIHALLLPYLEAAESHQGMER